MQFAIAYCGIPLDFYDRVYSSRLSFSGGSHYMGLPLGQGRLSYDTVYAEKIAGLFARLLGNDHHNALHDTCFAVIAVSYDAQSTPRFLSHFFPSTYCATVQWTPQWGTKTEMQASANSLIAFLRQATEKAKSDLRAMHEEVVSRSNSTPLLLPLKNFDSNILHQEFENIHHALPASSAAQFIKDVAARIRMSHPYAPQGNDPKRVYVDNARVIFASPGQARHAFARSTGGHPDACVLASKRRWGAPYDRAFHYDCTHKIQPTLQGTFANCHGQKSVHQGHPHLNIAPNDFVRP